MPGSPNTAATRPDGASRAARSSASWRPRPTSRVAGLVVLPTSAGSWCRIAVSSSRSRGPGSTPALRRVPGGRGPTRRGRRPGVRTDTARGRASATFSRSGFARSAVSSSPTIRSCAPSFEQRLPASFDREGAEFVEPDRLGRQGCRTLRDIGVGVLAVPKRECGVEQLAGAARVGAGGVVEHRLELGGVGGDGVEDVARRAGVQGGSVGPGGPQGAAQVGDVGLHGRARLRGWPLAPQFIDDPTGRHDLPTRGHEQGEQGTLLPATERDLARGAAESHRPEDEASHRG